MLKNLLKIIYFKELDKLFSNTFELNLANYYNYLIKILNFLEEIFLNFKFFR